MRDLAPPDTDRRMGRPPLKVKDPTVKTTIRLPTSVLMRIKAVSEDGEAAAFIREAVDAELRRREKSPHPRPNRNSSKTS